MYEAPTVDQFKARFQEFRAVEDASIQMVLDEAQIEVGANWPSDLRGLATMYLAAHLLSLSVAASPGAGGGTGPAIGAIKRRRVGDVEVEYETGGAAAIAGSASTHYIARYMELLGRSGPAILVV